STLSHTHPVFFFASRSRHTRFSRDWSSDVCSSDLIGGRVAGIGRRALYEQACDERDGPNEHVAQSEPSHGRPPAGTVRESNVPRLHGQSLSATPAQQEVHPDSKKEQGLACMAEHPAIVA